MCKWEPVTEANCAVAKILLNYGVDPSVPEDDPPIAYALDNHSIEMMDIFHARGVRIPQRAIVGYWEAREGSNWEAVCAYLVEKGYRLPEEEDDQQEAIK